MDVGSPVTPYLLYEDAAAALDWLVTAFGFRERSRHTNDAGLVDHAELEYGGGLVMLGSPDWFTYTSPRRSGHLTAVVHVAVDDADAHCARARAAGATIVQEPVDEPFGRLYKAEDPEGQRWLFSSPISSPTSAAPNAP
jgi:uncharacterized glyoxalase superfamily protein PhnB